MIGPLELARVLEVARRLAAARTPEAAASELERAIVELCEADGAACLFLDRESGELWHPVEARASEGDGTSARLDPHRVQVPVTDHDGQLQAVLVALRAPRRTAFEPRHHAILTGLATESAPMLRRLERELELRAEAAQGSGPFREEVMLARSERRLGGGVVRVSPRWVEWAYGPLVTMLVVGLLYLHFGTVHRYSLGQAMVEMSGRVEITAHTVGTVVSIPVERGQWVEAGDPIAKLYDLEEEAEFERIRGELEAQLRALMRSAHDAAAAQAVRTLRGQLESADARLAERTIRAPRAGSIVDVRMRPGQSIAPGEIVAALARDGEDPRVVALVPGSDRPLMQRGMRVRFEVTGYRYAARELIVDEVGDEVLSPAEARRVLGPSVADGLRIEQPVVVVRMRLPSATFEVDGETYRYHEGMRGAVEVRLRQESILQSLFPALGPRGART